MEAGRHFLSSSSAFPSTTQLRHPLPPSSPSTSGKGCCFHLCFAQFSVFFFWEIFREKVLDFGIQREWVNSLVGLLSLFGFDMGYKGFDCFVFECQSLD